VRYVDCEREREREREDLRLQGLVEETEGKDHLKGAAMFEWIRLN
jgi:hypothetical protein